MHMFAYGINRFSHDVAHIVFDFHFWDLLGIPWAVSFGIGSSTEDPIMRHIFSILDHISYFRWHLLTIIHYNHTVTVYYDDEEHEREIKGSTYHLALDPKVFVGGGDNFVVTRGRYIIHVYHLHYMEEIAMMPLHVRKSENWYLND